MPGRIATVISQAYATGTEFCTVFLGNMDSMHLLSFLLTADLTKAEECFVLGLEDCAKGSYVFRDWARFLGSPNNHPESSSYVGAPQEPLCRRAGTH